MVKARIGDILMCARPKENFAVGKYGYYDKHYDDHFLWSNYRGQIGAGQWNIPSNGLYKYSWMVTSRQVTEAQIIWRNSSDCEVEIIIT